jgi:hypothetical protein
MRTVITCPYALGIPEMVVPEGDRPGLTILAMGDALRIARESIGASDPLAAAIVREWRVTEAGTFLYPAISHTVYPQPADSGEAN